MNKSFYLLKNAPLSTLFDSPFSGKTDFSRPVTPGIQLDEWIYFLKNEEIKDEFNAKGLKQAKEQLDIMNLPEDEEDLLIDMLTIFTIKPVWKNHHMVLAC